ncbi:hypothetical protein M885DRAFT_570233 [Pelagophyceae sp. CCMP2097]|nr:hypothetical protein M885DRAFT_570233 [Pelagophyceae sp. CCMP2097]
MPELLRGLTWRKITLIASLLEALAGKGVNISVIALQETKLDPNAHLVTGTDLPGFSIIRKDMTKGKGGVCFLIRDGINAYEHTELGIDDPSTLWIRVTHVVPALQIGVTYLSPTELTVTRARTHFSRIDQVIRAAEAAGLAWILLGDFNSRGLNVAQSGRWLRAPRIATRSEATKALEEWLVDMHEDQGRAGASIVSGSLEDTGENCWARFAAHQGFNELDLVIASAGAVDCCRSCRTENGYVLLPNPIRISDHRALVATFTVTELRATHEDDGESPFSPLPHRKTLWGTGTQDEKAVRQELYREAITLFGTPLLAGAAGILGETTLGAPWLTEKIAHLVHRSEDAAGITKTGGGGAPKAPKAFFADGAIRAAFATAAAKQKHLEVTTAAHLALIDDASRATTPESGPSDGALRAAADARSRALQATRDADKFAEDLRRDAEAVRIFDLTLVAKPGANEAKRLANMISHRELRRDDERFSKTHLKEHLDT